MSRIKEYKPTIGQPDWDIKNLDKKERSKLKKRLGIAHLSNHKDYQKVITYMYKKFPREMDLTKLPDGSKNVPIQWKYAAGKNATYIMNKVLNIKQNMYAFVVFDKERDNEPIAFAGSYFTLSGIVVDDEANISFLCDQNGKLDSNGNYQFVGNGIVMFVDPSYRRMGLATDLWWAEAQLYRQALNIRFQREIQNEYSLVSTQKMFNDPSKCIITSQGRLKKDGTRSQIRCLLDYTDHDVIEGWKDMPDNLKTIYSPYDFSFMDREEVDDLPDIWKAGKLV